MSIIWTIHSGFIAGVIAKFLTPGDTEPSGFILTTILGIVGAFVATYLGQAIGWYRADEAAELIGAVVGAVIVLVVWGLIAGRRQRSVFTSTTRYLPARATSPTALTSIRCRAMPVLSPSRVAQMLSCSLSRSTSGNSV